jgi:hypothetical protein
VTTLALHWSGMGGIFQWPAAASGAESTGSSARTRGVGVRAERELYACVFHFFFFFLFERPLTVNQENN